MKLKIAFPDNILSKIIINQKFIPCLCKISRDFGLEFRDPLQEAVGIVLEWDYTLIEERAPALVGGEYSHYADGEISIMHVSEDIYDILDLKMFYPDYGWCPIIKDGDYAVPKEGLCDEE
ncbi:hypothetical protein [Komagataeibacter europaeus]|uniref:hypothetical protein n=1 Tax=Komagataeibacter europaeus TaxID=33995 RepID=UPI0009E41C58|nr:hypothetical protein [Komagataeibacter europaeus]